MVTSGVLIPGELAISDLLTESPASRSADLGPSAMMRGGNCLGRELLCSLCSSWMACQDSFVPCGIRRDVCDICRDSGRTEARYTAGGTPTNRLNKIGRAHV